MTYKHKTYALATLIILAIVLHPGILLAEKLPADQVNISTPVYTPPKSFAPQLGLYSYSVSWNGIPAGSAELELDRNDESYEIRARARTAKGIDLIYKLRYKSETVLDADTLKPKHSFSVVSANSRKKTTQVEFLPDGEILSTRKNHRGSVKTLKFNPDNFTLDPFSAGFLALSQEWKVGESRQFDLFSGKSRYLIEFSAVEQVSLTVNGELRSAIVIVPKVKSLTQTGDDADEKKMRETRIFIAADPSREILKVSSDLLFGSVNTEIVAFTPAGTSPASDTDKGEVATVVPPFLYPFDTAL